MKAEELRLNNMIIDRWGAVATVDTIGFESTVRISTATYKSESCSINDCQPIPLTEEWLVKLGFIKSPAANSIYRSIPELKAEIHFEFFRGGLVCVLYCSTGSFIPNDIKFVHQLQNLYFAVLGEELEVK